MKTQNFVRVGTNRAVLLVGSFAIKFARFRPIYGFLKAFETGGSRTSCGKCFLRRWIGHSVWGIRVNRLEYGHYQTHQDDTRIMPTLRMFLGGILIVQMRGLCEISQCEFDQIVRRNGYSTLSSVDLFSLLQYSKHPLTGRTVVVDYGDPRTIKLCLT